MIGLARPCECLRSVAPGWLDPPHQGREAPYGRRYVVPPDSPPGRDWLPQATADVSCVSCGGSGSVDRAPAGVCGCVRPIPEGWLFQPKASGDPWPRPPVGRQYLREPSGPPIATASSDCSACSGSGIIQDPEPAALSPDVSGLDLGGSGAHHYFDILSTVLGLIASIPPHRARGVLRAALEMLPEEDEDDDSVVGR